MKTRRLNRAIRLCLVVLCLGCAHPLLGTDRVPRKTRIASWYGEEHRGKLMANGKRFDPDKMTAASWFFPIGTRVEVKLPSNGVLPERKVMVVITDRGPARRLVRSGRVIDLSRAAFMQLAHPDLGLIPVEVRTLN